VSRPGDRAARRDRSPARLDLRLLGPAAAAWAGAGWAPSARPGLALATAAVAGLAAVGVATALAVRVAGSRRAACPDGRGAGGVAASRRPGPRDGDAAAGGLVVVGVLVCVAGGMLAAALRAQAREAGPLPGLAERRATVTADLVVTDDPRLLRPRPTPSWAGGPERVVVPARLEAVTASGVTTGLRAPVVVLAPRQGWDGLLPSQRVRVTGRLGPPREGDTVAATVSVRDPPDAVAEPSRVHRVAGALRAGLRAAVEPLPAREEGLLPGLVVGDVSRLDPDLREDFRRTGMSHLVAVSGSNVAIVLAAALLAARWLRAGPRAAPAAAGLALAGFVVLARPSPSVLRAGVTGAVGVVALATGRRRSALPALLAAVLVLVLVEPALARAPGFALSVSATAGLLLLAPPLRDAFARRLPRPLAEALAVAVAAQVAVSPVVAALSAEVSLIAVPANLLAVPAVPPATVLGVLTALLAPVSMPLAQLVARAAGVPTTWLVTVAERGAQVPVGAVPWPGGSRGGLLLAAVAVAVGVLLVVRPARRLLAAATAGSLAAVVVLVPLVRGGPPAGWAVAFCDVGQGDAVVLAAGPDAGVLVDAGPDPDAVDRCLRDLGVRRVPRVLLTHLHADHVDGLRGVLRGRAVGAVELVPLHEPAGALAEVERVAAAAGVPVETSVTGEVRVVGALRWRVLGPVRSFRGSGDDPNNNSIVLRVELPGLTALLTGDVEPEAQAALLEAGADLRADVLKVPHHGSRHQDPQFLRAVGARVAVASTGAGNTYGHPAPETLDLLAASGAHVYRTDLDSTVVLAVRSGSVVAVTAQRRRLRTPRRR
jgi:competence protein ComEC